MVLWTSSHSLPKGYCWPKKCTGPFVGRQNRWSCFVDRSLRLFPGQRDGYDKVGFWQHPGLIKLSRYVGHRLRFMKGGQIRSSKQQLSILSQGGKSGNRNLLPQVQLPGTVSVNPMVKIRAKIIATDKCRGLLCITVGELIKQTRTIHIFHQVVDSSSFCHKQVDQLPE